jgi:hypothetical protein
MADVVNGRNLILYAQIGADMKPIGCAKEFDMTITTEMIELAPKTDSSYKTYKPGKKDIRFSGSGLVKIISTDLYNSTDLVASQLAGQKFNVRFSITDPQANEVRYECSVYINETVQSKTSGRLASYTFQMTCVSKITVVGGTNSGGIFTQQYTTQYV